MDTRLYGGQITWLFASANESVEPGVVSALDITNSRAFSEEELRAQVGTSTDIC